MPDYYVRLFSQILDRFRDRKAEMFSRLMKNPGEFWQQADAEYKADPDLFKSLSLKTSSHHFRAPWWMRWLAARGFCEIGSPAKWRAKQGFLWTLWHDYLNVHTGMKFSDLCSLFVNSKGKSIDPDYITKHTSSTNYPAFDSRTAEGLERLLWPDSKK